MCVKSYKIDFCSGMEITIKMSEESFSNLVGQDWGKAIICDEGPEEWLINLTNVEAIRLVEEVK